MKTRVFLPLIIGAVWILLLALVLRHPMEWDIHEGRMHSAAPVSHEATGVTVTAPVLRVESIRSEGDGRRGWHGEDVYIAEDARIDSLRLMNDSAFFGKGLCHTMQNYLRPLPLSADKVHPQEGWSIQQVEGNTVSLIHEDGNTIRYTYSYLPQGTNLCYSGEKSADSLTIYDFEAERYCTAYAVSDSKEGLENTYAIYRAADRFSGLLARAALLLLTVFGGMALFCTIRTRILREKELTGES